MVCAQLYHSSRLLSSAKSSNPSRYRETQLSTSVCLNNSLVYIVHPPPRFLVFSAINFPTQQQTQRKERKTLDEKKASSSQQQQLLLNRITYFFHLRSTVESLSFLLSFSSSVRRSLLTRIRVSRSLSCSVF